MRLIAPSPGEAYDRLTILNLKVVAAEAKGLKDYARAFEIERGAISEYLLRNFRQIPTNYAQELGEINSILWKLEDEQRVLILKVEENFAQELGKYLMDFVNNACRVIHLNDARAECIQKINKELGVQQPEKLHYQKAHVDPQPPSST